MNRVKRVPLDPEAAARLSAMQARVNEAGDFDARVTLAKKLFGSLNRAGLQGVRKSLCRMCPGIERCMFCEDSVGTAIEHFLPKSLFPGEALAWNNYLLACSRCNGKKSDSFAAIATPETRGWAWCGERELSQRVKDNALLDPSDAGVDPSDALWLDLDEGTLIPRRGAEDRLKLRAHWTIDVLDLNRAELTRKRASTFECLLDVLSVPAGQTLGPRLARVQRHVDTMDCPFVWTQAKRQWASSATLKQLAQRLPEAYIEAILKIRPKQAS
jgi:uncharacterized protein (TIGR02646 family)